MNSTTDATPNNMVAHSEEAANEAKESLPPTSTNTGTGEPADAVEKSARTVPEEAKAKGEPTLLAYPLLPH